MRKFQLIVPLLLTLAMLSLPLRSVAQVGIGVVVNIAPPPLPVYDQPPCPGDDYIWTPGYWAWDGSEYYWVPGTWVLAPEPGFFWTPGFWAWQGSGFVFTAGYWGPVVGFYGGIDYGFGYFGHGYVGGRWQNGHFFYNRAVSNVNVTVIHNTYNTVIRNTTVNRVSYNGGNGGINARPTREEEAAARERHVPPVAAQVQHEEAARSNRELRASVNHGRPPIAATSRPGAFKESGAVPARNVAVHPNELPPLERPPAPNTGNAKLDQKYQKQQEKLVAQQEKERQKLQQQQNKEHQQMAKQQANAAKQQQMEQRHQQQTERLEERQAQQTQHLQTRQAPPPRRMAATPPKPH